MRVEMVVIDGIKAFLEEERPLGLKAAMPGAVRAANMIKEGKKRIKRIYAFVDAHHRLHVNHKWYWIETKTNDYPKKGTLITTEALKKGIFRPINPAWTSDMIEYSEALDKKERYCIYIFDDHALIGTDECNMVDCFNEAFDEDKDREGGGEAEENEDIQLMEIPVQKAINMVDDWEITDAKTIIGLQWLERRLRSGY